MESKVYIISKIIWVLLDIETNFLRSRFTNRYCIAIERIVTVRKTEIKKKRISRFPKFLPLVIFVILFIPCTLSIFSFFLFFYFFPQTKGRQFEENSDTRGTIAVGPSKGNTFLAGDFHTRVRRPGWLLVVIALNMTSESLCNAKWYVVRLGGTETREELPPG